MLYVELQTIDRFLHRKIKPILSFSYIIAHLFLILSLMKTRLSLVHKVQVYILDKITVYQSNLTPYKTYSVRCLISRSVKKCVIITSTALIGKISVFCSRKQYDWYFVFIFQICILFPSRYTLIQYLRLLSQHWCMPCSLLVCINTSSIINICETDHSLD